MNPDPKQNPGPDPGYKHLCKFNFYLFFVLKLNVTFGDEEVINNLSFPNSMLMF